jgi:hypothetical protein
MHQCVNGTCNCPKNYYLTGLTCRKSIKFVYVFLEITEFYSKILNLAMEALAQISQCVKNHMDLTAYQMCVDVIPSTIGMELNAKSKNLMAKLV